MGEVKDLVVIGSGIGGLTAAALAAADGLETVLLEGHYRPGGCAGDYTRRGVHIPVGATLASGFEPGGLHEIVYRRLGIDAKAEPLERAMDVHLPDREVSVWNDAERWAAEWRRAFPGEEARKQAFWGWTAALGSVVYRTATRLPVMPLRSAADALALLRAVRLDSIRLAPWLTRRVGAAFEDLFAADTAHRRFVDIQLLDATGCETRDCAAVNAAIALDIYRHGCFRLPGGMAEIANDLAGSLRRSGGELRYFSRVQGLSRRNGVWQLRTQAGEEFATRQVIANLPAWDLPALLGLPLRPAPARDAWGACVLSLVIDARGLPVDLHPFHQVLHSYEHRSDEGNNCFVSIQSGSRRGLCAVTASTHVEAQPWWREAEEHLALRRSRIEERLLTAAARVIPDLRGRVQLQELSDPRTFARYTGRRLGLVGGLRQTVRNSAFGALSFRSGLPGLYLCGDSVFPGQGSVGVTLSALNAWRTVMTERQNTGRGRVWAAWRPLAKLTRTQ